MNLRDHHLALRVHAAGDDEIVAEMEDDVDDLLARVQRDGRDRVEDASAQILERGRRERALDGV